MRAHYNHLDPFLTEDGAATMLRLAENFSSFGPYANEAENDGIGEELPQRFDAAFNYIAHGMDGSENKDDARTAAAKGAAERLRPILSTTMTTLVGLVPLALSSPKWMPLCAAIICGLITGTISAFVFIPSAYYLLTKDKAS